VALQRRRAIGAEIVDGGVHIRLWAPSRQTVAVVIDGRDHPLEREKSGYFSGLIKAAGTGTRYRIRLDEEEETFPDPASRYQPDGPHGDSQVVDPHAYVWQAPQRALDKDDLVVIEVHIGTLTHEGTFAAAIDRLPGLADAGINLIEVMPINEFPGRFGWGYDGVDLWAPTRLYGTPDDFRSFVDAAHALRLGVILDVVYNHLGPDGCYLPRFTPSYFTKKYINEWGSAINFDGEEAGGVREFFAENAAYWIDEFHLDGLRLDATQSIHDESRPHVIQQIAERARAAAGDRDILLVAETERQDTALVDDYGIDAMWNDDWHHAAMVALTGRREAYYTDYLGAPQEFVSMAKHGFLYQGQRYGWQHGRRGTPSLHLPARRLVVFLQNHDQIANSLGGDRIHRLAAPGVFRAMTALLLLGPNTPMLFQGQEYGSSKPFLYFADHGPELARQVRGGRSEFMKQFPSLRTAEAQQKLRPTEDPATFEACKLDDWERDRNTAILTMHRDLIRLRRSEAAFRRPDTLEGSVLGTASFLLRWIAGGSEDRLLLVNLGADSQPDPVAEPLLAPPRGYVWEPAWSSESIAYGGGGTSEIESKDGVWRLPGHAAVLMRPRA
jgi:maltooligosyltrehalose trehalohydrolase